MNIELEVLLAAVIDQMGGEVWLNEESVQRNFTDQLIAIDHDPVGNRFRLALIDADDVEYEDEDGTE